MTRLTITIPAAAAPAVNAALVEAIGPEAAVFSVHPPHPDRPDDLDTTVMVTSWDLAATGHEDVVDLVAQTVEQLGKTGTGKTAKTADVRVGPEPTLATKVTAAELTAATLDVTDAKH